MARLKTEKLSLEGTMQLLGDKWEIYSGKQTIVGFDLDLMQVPEKEKYPIGRRVVFFIPLGMQVSGMPNTKGLRALEGIENTLLSILFTAEIDCRLAARKTGHGLRELVFQITDSDAFDDIVNTWETTMAFKVIDADGWNYLEQSVFPDEESWQQILDRRVIREMIANGANPQKIHVIEHLIIGPEDALKEISMRFLDSEYGTSRENNALIVTHELKLEPALLATINFAMRNMCKSMGAHWNGWRTKIRS